MWRRTEENAIAKRANAESVGGASTFPVFSVYAKPKPMNSIADTNYDTNLALARHVDVLGRIQARICRRASRSSPARAYVLGRVIATNGRLF